LRLANGQQQAFRCAGIGGAVFFAQIEIFLQGIFFLTSRLESLLKVAKNAHCVTSLDLRSRRGSFLRVLTTRRHIDQVNPPEPKGRYRRKPVVRLSPFLDGLSSRIVRSRRGQGALP